MICPTTVQLAAQLSLPPANPARLVRVLRRYNGKSGFPYRAVPAFQAERLFLMEKTAFSALASGQIVEIPL
jgi:hypothetical protein